MYPAGVLSVLVTATTGQANASLRKTQTMFRATASVSETSASRTAAAWKRTGFVIAAATAFAAASTAKLSIDFDKDMRNVNSIAQLSEKRFQKLRQSVLDIAGPTAQAPDTLAKGMYQLVSSGFNAAQSLIIVKQAAYAATAGLTTTEVSTKAVAAVLNAYQKPATDAKEVSDKLFQTVNLGVLTFDDLAQHIGDTLPFASQLGVRLGELGAATSTMTKQGLSSAETMTRLRNIMQTLIKPGTDLTDTLDSMNMTGSELIKKKGLEGALNALIATTDGSKEAVAKLFPNIRALGGVLALTGKHSNAAAKDLKGFQDTAGATQTVLKQQRKSVAYQWNKLKAELSATAIKIGDAILPVFFKAIPLIGNFVNGIVDMVKWVAKLPTPLLGAAGAFMSAYLAIRLLQGVVAAFNMVAIYKSLTAFITVAGGAIVEMGLLRGAWFALSLAFATNPLATVAVGIGLVVGAALTLRGILGGGDGLTKLQERLAASSDRLSKAMDAQKNSSKALAASSKGVKNAKHQEAQADKRVSQAEDHLNKIRSHFGKHSVPVLRAEAALARAKNKDAKATDKVRQAERLDGVQKKATKITYRDTVAAATERIITLKQERKQIARRLAEDIKSFKQTHVWTDQAKQDQADMADNSKNMDTAQKDLTGTIGKAGNEIGGPFSKSLKDAARQLINSGASSKKLAKLLQDPYGTSLQDTIRKNQALAMSGQTLRRAMPGDYKQMAAGSSRGIQQLGSETQKALSALGVKAHVAFPAGPKVPTHATGGMLVPGHGVGDKVPLHLAGQLAAFVEPGEIVNIGNKNLAKAMAAGNQQYPRYAKGGSMGAMVGEVNKFEAQHFPYLWGGGHGSFGIQPVDCSGFVSDVLHAGGLLNGAPMVSGSLMSWGKPGKGPLTVYANPEHTFMSLNGRLAGTSNSNPGGGAGWIEGGLPASYVAGFAARTMGTAATEIKRIFLNGPDGLMDKMGQGSLDMVRSAADKFIMNHMPTGTFGGADGQLGSVKALPGGWKRVGGTYEGLAGAGGSSGLGVGGMSFAELLVAGANAGMWQQDLAATLGLPNRQGYGMPDNTRIQVREPGAKQAFVANKTDVGSGQQGNPFYKIDLQDQLANALAGPVTQNVDVKKMAKGGSLGLPHTLNRIRGQANARKRIKDISKYTDKIKDIGLNNHIKKKIHHLTAEMNQFEEYASRANTASQYGINEVMGHSEGEWLHKKLAVMMNLRNVLIRAHKRIQHKRDEISKQVKLAHDKLKVVNLQVIAAKKKARELQHRINSVHKNKQAAEHKLSKAITAAKKKKHNKAEVQSLQKQLAAIKSSNPADALKAILSDDNKKLRRSQVVQSALRNKIIPAITTQGTKLDGNSHTLMQSLQQLQGIGSPMRYMRRLPNHLGVLGGDILDAQTRLKDLRGAASGGLTGLDIGQLIEFANEVRLGAFADDLPRFHSGGFVSPPGGASEMAAVLKKGEFVVDADTVRSGANGGGDTYVVLEFANGMEWLGQFVTTRIEKRDRKTKGAYRVRKGA